MINKYIIQRTISFLFAKVYENLTHFTLLIPKQNQVFSTNLSQNTLFVVKTNQFFSLLFLCLPKNVCAMLPFISFILFFWGQLDGNVRKTIFFIQFYNFRKFTKCDAYLCIILHTLELFSLTLCVVLLPYCKRFLLFNFGNAKRTLKRD